jgi:hypothetical protein
MAGGLGWRRPVGPGQGGGGVGLFSGQQVERLVIAALREVTLDEAMDRAGNLTEQPGDVVVPWRRQRMKLHGAVGPAAKTPSGSTAWAWQLRLSSEPKRCTKVMAPACGSAMPCARARRRCQANSLERNTPSVGSSGRCLGRAETAPDSAMTMPIVDRARWGVRGRRDRPRCLTSSYGMATIIHYGARSARRLVLAGDAYSLASAASSSATTRRATHRRRLAHRQRGLAHRQRGIEPVGDVRQRAAAARRTAKRCTSA